MPLSARSLGAAFLCTVVVACSSGSKPAASGPSLPGPSTPPPPPAAANTVVTAIAGRPELSTLAAQVVAAGLDDDLAAAEAVTVFAPTNDALARLTARTSPSNEDLTKILLYHVLGSKVMAADITAAGISAPTLRDLPGRESFPLTAQLVGTQVLIGGQAFVTVADIQTDNGVVHIIDSVLWAPDEGLRYPGTIADVLADYPAFATLKAAVENESLVGAFNGTGACTSSARCTLFAPLQSAFTALGADTVTGLLADAKLGEPYSYASNLAQILQYHVVASEVPASTAVTLKTARSMDGRYIGLGVTGGVLDLSNVDMATPSNVIGTNFFASNGVVHTINAVLVPPFRTLADLATGTGDAGFATLGTAVADPDAGLVPALSGSATTGDNCTKDNPCTLFAPNNAAFARLIDALELADAAALLEELGAGLQNVLLQHVSAGAADSTAVAAATSLDTLFDDDSARISVTDGKVYVNTLTQVTGTDVIAANGILHTVDSLISGTSSTVIFPGNLAEAAKAYPRLSSFAGNLTTTLSDNLSDTGLCNSGSRCTVFAPTNAAFDAFVLGEKSLETVLFYHVIPEQLDAAAVVAQGTRPTAINSTTYIGFRGGVTPKAGNVDVSATIVGTDFFTDNGVIHLVDTVLYPAESSVYDVVTSNTDFSTLNAAIVRTDSDNPNLDMVSYLDGSGSYCLTNQPCTVFAPNNAAFGLMVSALGESNADGLFTTLGDSLPSVLWTHIYNGWVDYQEALTGLSDESVAPSPLVIQVPGINDEGALYVNGATKITSTDIVTKNGIIHVVDSVLVPTTSSLRFPGLIEDYLAAYPRLSTLRAGLDANPVGDTMTTECLNSELNDERCTFFAPTNQALQSANVPPMELNDVLRYHVLGTEQERSEFANNDTLTTLQGSTVQIKVDFPVYSLNDATDTDKTMFQMDIFTRNGVVHLIDGVLRFPVP